ncbi:hypothetical protein [Pelagicoccus sp. SDUM812002]|uniref:hypothetical protein n=1 Tax=Pelagicoccus sp. SDUM812002 TaxID=3041266 RepID=UPI00280F34B3|nr:hypothetical protein [Pelagicoccus sp. SDUM812002]MDQ8188285.1 hypothetical protein [Pelagicoccus sp. SDUM812002]
MFFLILLASNVLFAFLLIRKDQTQPEMVAAPEQEPVIEAIKEFRPAAPLQSEILNADRVSAYVAAIKALEEKKTRAAGRG